MGFHFPMKCNQYRSQVDLTDVHTEFINCFNAVENNIFFNYFN